MEKKSKNYDDPLHYHEDGRPGKIEVVPTKPSSTMRDLSMAYSPGVAEPCKEIADDPDKVYRYTAKGNLVGVISNGTAVLGLGNIGPEASKPVMEGKGVLFKIFADIDVFDIEVNAEDVDTFVNTVKALEPTFGGINLEDIAAPESFEIEERLVEAMNIPVMHDDQHGTAIIVGAALINALKIVEKDIDKLKIVCSGAGASAIACCKLIVGLGVRAENIAMFDRKGHIYKERGNYNKYQEMFAQDKPFEDMAEALKGADMFIGLSVGGVLKPEMVKGMADDPIVFALSNPDPEIDYELAMETRDDILMATGRSDHPNQVNNVLGFPFIFRGALDVRATKINEEMKLAASKAIAELATEPVPEIVNIAYNSKNTTFGRDYIIPKPLDPRLVTRVAPAVAKAAMESGVAKAPISDWAEYEQELRERLGIDNKFIQYITEKARQEPKRVVFAEADNYRSLKAAEICKLEKLAFPILLGRKKHINKLIEEHHLQLDGVSIIDPYEEHDRRERFAEVLYNKRQRRGITRLNAQKLMRHRNYFGVMMVETGEADVHISGLTDNYARTIAPALEVIGKQDGCRIVAGMYALMTKRGLFFLSDATVNIDPEAQDLVDITLLMARTMKQLNVDPRIALLSYSNFGSVKGRTPSRVQEAVKMLHANHPELVVDGDIQANFAINPELRAESFDFSKLGDRPANAFVVPKLAAGNISYKLLQELGGVEAIGPVLMGFKKSVHIVQMGSSVREIVNMVALGVVDAQEKEKMQYQPPQPSTVESGTE